MTLTELQAVSNECVARSRVGDNLIITQGQFAALIDLAYAAGQVFRAKEAIAVAEQHQAKGSKNDR